MKRFSFTLAGWLLSLTLLLLPSHAYAASASMYLSPGSTRVANGSYLTIYIYENSGGTAVNSVQANLSYTSSLLQFVSIGSSSAFGIVAQNSGGGGSVKIARGALPSVSGTQLVASVTFKALSSSGTASISFASGSAVVSASGSSNILGSKSGGSYTLTKPAPAPKKPAPDTKAPTIKNVNVTDIKYNSATLTWDTSEPATSEVDYGLNTKYGLVAQSSKLVTKHKVVLNSPIISPGLEYHFLVRSADAAGNKAASKDATFKTKGATLTVTVLGQNNKPLSGAKVTFAGQTKVTDEKGQATFTDLPEGLIAGTIEYGNQKTATSVTVESIDPTGKAQLASLKINAKPSSLAPLYAAVALIIGIAVAWWLRGKIDRNSGGSGGVSGGPKGISKLFSRKKDTDTVSNNTPSAGVGEQIISPQNKP